MVKGAKQTSSHLTYTLPQWEHKEVRPLHVYLKVEHRENGGLISDMFPAPTGPQQLLSASKLAMTNSLGEEGQPRLWHVLTSDSHIYCSEGIC